MTTTRTVRPTRCLPELFDEAADDAASRPAVRDQDGVWNYRELTTASHAVASWLRCRGVGRGDRVVTRMTNTRHLVAMFLGTVRIGAVFVPLNTAVREFQLGTILTDAAPRVVVVEDDAVESIQSLVGCPVYARSAAWEQVEAQADPAHPRVESIVQPDDVAALVYTSGSTAMPRAVVETHAQMVFATMAIQHVLGYRPDDTVFCRFTLSWDYGLYKVLLCAAGRSELVLAGTESDLLLLNRMRETGATIVPIVPSLAHMILGVASRDPGPVPPVRMFTNTGAALSAATADALRQTFPGARVVRQFGLTECKRVSIMPPELELTRLGSVGLPLPGTEVAICDPDGRPLPPGCTGEIVVTGPHVMTGYWRAPEATARTFRWDAASGNQRLHTGDYGHLDTQGFLYFDGRRDDMFKRHGVRMSTVEIEAAAMDIPEVRAAAVLPPTDDQDLVLYVEASIPAHQVLRQLSRRLEPAKVPAAVHVVARLPLTTHGKNARVALATMRKDDNR